MRSSPPKNPLSVAARALARTVPQAAIFKKPYPRRSARCARAEEKKGDSKGDLLCTPLWLLSLVTLFRNTKESDAHPGRGKNINYIVKYDNF